MASEKRDIVWKKWEDAHVLLSMTDSLAAMETLADRVDISTLTDEERQQLVESLDPPLRRLKALRKTLARGDNGYTC